MYHIRDSQQRSQRAWGAAVPPCSPSAEIIFGHALLESPFPPTELALDCFFGAAVKQ